MAAFKKIAIFGVGLIGGSFALALKKSGAVNEVLGVGRRPETLVRAAELGIIDSHTADVAQAVAGADLVLIAAPTASLLHAMAPHLAADTVVTDAGSTKTDVVAAARAALGSKIHQFVPGHPIAGREQNGPEAALSDLYAGKKIILTALPENPVSAVDRVTDAWQRCGALVHHLTAANTASCSSAVR
jgi:prephenate dehydrogenase